MKFATITLLLGCSAFVCPFAVQSEFVHVNPPLPHGISQIRSLLERLRLWIYSPELATPTYGPPAPVNPLLSKEESLQLIASAATKYRVPPAFVASIVTAESNFNCAAISPRGAIGLMQLMPDTAQEFGADPAVPAQNVDAGTHYLRWLIDRYHKRSSSITRVIAAYNAGPGNVDRYHGIPPFRETRNYVTRVLRILRQFSQVRTRIRGPILMAGEVQSFAR